MNPPLRYIPLAVYEFATDRFATGYHEDHVCILADGIEDAWKVALELLRPYCGALRVLRNYPNPRRMAVREGELCPYCFSKNVECEGAVPDGVNLNMAYKCKVCNGKWEGD